MALQIGVGSAGVGFSEIDLTTVVPSVSTTIAAFVGNFNWGPASIKTAVSDEAFLLRKFQKPDSNTYLSFFSAANFLQYGNSLVLVRAVANTSNNATASGNGLLIKNEQVWQNSYFSGAGFSAAGLFAARYPGSAGNGLIVSICPSANAFASNLTSGLSATANTVVNSNVVVFNTNVYSQLQTNDLLSVAGGGYVLVTNVATNGTTITVNSGANFANANGQVAIRKWLYNQYFSGAPGTSAYAASVAGANDQMHVIVIDTKGTFTATSVSPVNIGGANTIIDQFPFVSKAIDAKNSDGSAAYVRDVIYSKSNYVYWMGNPAAGTNWGNTAAGTTFTEIQYPIYNYLTGGQDAAPADGDLQSGWDLFNNTEEIDVSLLITGAVSTTVSNYVLSTIAANRQDAVAFISPLQNDVVNQPGSEVTNITTTRNAFSSSSYGFMDCNWKLMFDKYNNVDRWVPLNPDIAGLCVKTDISRAPWFSIAGYSRGQIKNVKRLAWQPNKSQRDTLYNIGVNPVLTFQGQGPILFGDKTLLSQPSAFDQLGVRRLFQVLEKAITKAARFSLFEFNDEFTRSNFVNMVEPFLRDVQGRRGITAFRVQCDTNNNTDSVISNKQFVGDIYVKPNYSINWIQLNFVAVRGSVDFNYVIGQF